MKIWENGKVRDMTESEIKEYENYIKDITVEQPTEFDKLEAQVAYTALMTDTLLTEGA